MYTISNNGFVTITRGDSFEAPLFINQGTTTVPVRWDICLHEEATVYVGVMEYNQPFEEATIRKYFTGTACKQDVADGTHKLINKEGDIIVRLNSTDTEYLLPGKYYYEVKVDFGNGKIDTAIPKTEFFILE